MVLINISFKEKNPGRIFSKNVSFSGCKMQDSYHLLLKKNKTIE